MGTKTLVTCAVLALMGCREGTATPAAASGSAEPPPPDAASVEVPASAARPAWDGRGAFVFSLSDSHFFLGGTQMFLVDADGNVDDLFARKAPTQWALASYTLTPAEHAELRRLVHEANLAALQAEYTQPQVNDPTATTFSLHTPQGRLSTRCSGANRDPVPAALLPVYAFVQARISAHAADRAKAPASTPNAVRELWEKEQSALPK